MCLDFSIRHDHHLRSLRHAIIFLQFLVISFFLVGDRNHLFGFINTVIVNFIGAIQNPSRISALQTERDNNNSEGPHSARIAQGRAKCGQELRRDGPCAGIRRIVCVLRLAHLAEGGRAVGGGEVGRQRGQRGAAVECSQSDLRRRGERTRAGSRHREILVVLVVNPGKESV